MEMASCLLISSIQLSIGKTFKLCSQANFSPYSSTAILITMALLLFQTSTRSCLNLPKKQSKKSNFADSLSQLVIRDSIYGQSYLSTIGKERANLIKFSSREQWNSLLSQWLMLKSKTYSKIKWPNLRLMVLDNLILLSLCRKLRMLREASLCLPIWMHQPRLVARSVLALVKVFDQLRIKDRQVVSLRTGRLKRSTNVTWRLSKPRLKNAIKRFF